VFVAVPLDDEKKPSSISAGEEKSRATGSSFISGISRYARFDAPEVPQSNQKIRSKC
jgi:hypothetical protein